MKFVGLAAAVIVDALDEPFSVDDVVSAVFILADSGSLGCVGSSSPGASVCFDDDDGTCTLSDDNNVDVAMTAALGFCDADGDEEGKPNDGTTSNAGGDDSSDDACASNRVAVGIIGDTITLVGVLSLPMPIPLGVCNVATTVRRGVGGLAGDRLGE